MTKATINLKDMVVLVADGSAFFSRLVHSILRSFGTTKVLEVRSTWEVLRTLSNRNVDVLICDVKLPPHGGDSLVRAIRRKADHEHRTIPILLMTSDPREQAIHRARDAGANMVIAKPLSPTNLYDRLAWIALTPRQFIDCPTYFGPDRRFKIEGWPQGVGRRKSDQLVQIAAESGPALDQGDIDNLFTAARMGSEP